MVSLWSRKGITCTCTCSSVQCGRKWIAVKLDVCETSETLSLMMPIIGSYSQFVLTLALASYVFSPRPIQLFVWNHSSCTPYQRYSEHCAAVKAISWSPHQHGLLASGGGTADRTIRFWNTLTGTQIQSVDTGSQVSTTYSI